MANHLKKSAHLLKNASGHLVNECGNQACEYCDGATPETFEAVFSGLAFCCRYTFALDRSYIYSDPDGHFSGVITLTRRPSPALVCRWEYSATLTGTYYDGDPDGCAGDVYSTWTTRFTVRLEKLSSTEWRLDFFSDPDSGSILFTGTVTGETNCTASLEINNDYTDCATDGTDGVNGTATVSVPA